MNTKRAAYDTAAEAWHTHALDCQTCTLHGPTRCDLGERLLLAENEAWNHYQTGKADGPAAPR